MRNIWHRSLSMFLAAVMVFGLLPVNAFAAETGETTTETTAPVEEASSEDTAAAEVAAVQAMIDALPTEVATEEEAIALEEQIAAVDDAMAELYTEQSAQLDYTRYSAAVAALEAFWSQDYGTEELETSGYKYEGTTVKLYQDTEGNYTFEVKDGKARAGELYDALVIAIGEPTKAGGYETGYQKAYKVGKTVFSDNSNDEVTLECDDIVYKTVGTKYGIATTYDGGTAITVKVYHEITVATNLETVGGITYNGTAYKNGETVKVFTGENVTVNAVNGYTISECSPTTITESGTFSVNYVAEGAALHTVMLKVNGEEYGTASLSKTGEVQEGTQVTLTATPNTSSNSAVAYYVDSVEITGATLSDNTFTVGSEPVEVTVTFAKRELTLNGDQAIEVNGYTDNMTLRTEGLKQKLVEAAVGEGAKAADYTVYLWADLVYTKKYVSIEDSTIANLLSGWIQVPGTEKIKIVWNASSDGTIPAVSREDIEISVSESRTSAGLVSKILPDLTYNSADEIQAYVEVAAASSEVNPHGLNVTVEKTGGEIPSVAGTSATLTYKVSFKENEQYLAGSCTLTVTVTGNYSACTVTADSSVTAGGSMSVNGGSNSTVPGNSTVTVVVTPSGSNAVETITVTNTMTGEQVTTSAIGYKSKAATVTFTSGGASGAEAYVVSATYSEAKLSLKDGQTITYCIDNDKVNVNLKELVFGAVYDSSNPALKSGDVTVEYAYAGALGYNLWASVSKDPSYIGHKFGEDGSETIRVTYQSEKYGKLEAQVELNVFDSCYNNTIKVQTKAPEGVKADFSVDYSVDGREYQNATYFKQDTEMSVTLTPSGEILEVLGQIYNGTYSDSVAYIKSVTVKADGKEIDATVSRGQGSLLNGNLYNATVTFTTASNTDYTIIAEYGVLDMNAKQGDVTLQMYHGGMNYDPEVPSAEEIFNAVIGDCSDDFLEQYENMTVEFSADRANYTWKDVTDENLLALEDGTKIRVRITWKGEPYTYYPVAITKDVTLKDQRTPVIITGTIPTEKVEFVEESQLLESLKAVLGVEILADGNVLEDASYAMTYELSGDEESGVFANVTVTYDGTAEYKPGAKTFENVPIADIPDNAMVHVEILNASAVITNQADVAQNAVDGVYTVRGNSEYTFKFTPADGYAIERVSVNGGEVRLTYDAQVASFAMTLAEKEHYEVVIETVPAQFELKDERVYGFAPGWETPENAQIVDAVVAGPEDLDMGEVKVEYLARSEGTAQITIPEIVILEGIWSIPASTMDIELGELWLDPTAEINEVDLENIVDALVVELFDKVKSGELSLNEVRGYVESHIRSLTLNAHAFGANGDGSTEIIRISYEDDKYLIAETRTDVTIHDERVPTVLAASDCEVSYGYSLSQLLAASGAAVTAEGAAVSGTAIKTNDLYLHAGEEAQKVTLYFSGNEQYQPCEVTINVTVKKAAASIDYDSQTVTYGDAYDFTLGVTPTVMPDGTAADIQILEFMIGLDMHKMLDVDIEDKDVGLDQSISYIQIRLPESIRESVVGKYLQGEMSLGEFADLVESMGDMFGMSEESVSAFGQIIEAITGVTDSMEIKVILSADNFEPRNIGVYIAGAVTIDSDFETAYTADYLIITPATVECELAWNHTDSNGIMTLPAYQESYCEMMGAHVVENVQTGMTGETLATANDHIKYLILAVNDDNGEFLTTDVYGNIEANIYVNLEDIQNNGAYVQIAYMLNWGNEIYYAMPIVRSFLITPNTAEVTFVDESGAENPDRKFVFDNEQHAMDVAVDGEVVAADSQWLTVTYVGVQTNMEVYNSTEAPKHAGAYTVTAVYVEKDGDGNLLKVGAAVGAMAIAPSESDICVDNAVHVYDGKPFDTNKLIHADSVNSAVTPDTTIITAAIATDGSFSEVGLEAVQGAVNVDFPAWLDEIFSKHFEGAYANGVTTKDFVGKLEQYTETLKNLGVTDEMLRSMNNLLGNLPDDVTLTFKNQSEVNPLAVGAYLIMGLVTDSDHYPSADAGLLIITPNAVEAMLSYTDGDENNIYTVDSLKIYDLTADAFVDDEYSEAATAQVENVFVGVDINGDMVTTTDYTTLLPGEYVELSYILDVDSTTYYAEPISRVIIVATNLYDVAICDENGKENPHREFTYDGSAKSIGEIVITNQDGSPVVIGEEDELAVTYIGIDSIGNSYNSPNAPVNAGVYGVVVTFKDNNEDGTLIGIGSVTGVMVIHKAELTFDLKDTTISYNGEEQFVTVENPENADYLTVILDRKTNTANILLEDDAEELIALLEEALGYDLPDQITLAELRQAVQDALDTIKSYEIPAHIAAIAAVLTADVQQSLAQLLEKDIKPALEELKAVLKELNGELPESARITINAEKPVNVGTYECYAIAISANYKPQVSQGVLTIEPAEVEITVADVEKTYGETDPELTYTIAGLIGDDKLDAKLSRAEGENAGTYAITATVEEIPNYAVTVIPGTLTIKPAEVKVTAADAAKVYGEADPEFTYSAEGLKGEDKLNVKLSRAEGENVGTYVITAMVEKNDNYNIDVASGILTITERAVSVKLDSYTLSVGDALPAWTYTVTAGEVVQGETLMLTISCDAKNTNNAGTYTITAVDNDPNYAITVTGGTLTVQKRQEDTDDHEGYYPIEFDPKQDSTGTIVPGGTVEVDGAPYVLDENCTAWVPNTDAKLVTTYKYKVGDSHYQTYPTNMYVWFLTITDSDGDRKADRYSAERVKELDDFFKYEGTSIRVNFSSNGIRFFTSVPADACQQLMNGKLLTGSLSGYKLVQAGTLYTRWRGEGSCLTLATGVSSDVYGGKAGDAFRVFSKVGNRNWYTGVLTGLDGDADTLGMDILSRPFVTLEHDGEQLILYGGTVQRSIYYVAVQNRNYWAAGTAYDNFIESIIATVESAR